MNSPVNTGISSKKFRVSFPQYKYNSPAIETDTPVGYLDVCATEKYV